MSQVTLTLLDNAHNFIGEALRKAVLSEKDQGQWKFAIFNLVQAIELLLKEKLRQEHRILIFKNIDKPETTVSIESAITRLRACFISEFKGRDGAASVVSWRYESLFHC